MSHPCDGHACDHCYLCDVVGVCCLTVATGRKTHDQSAVASNVLRAAIVADAETVPGLPELVRLEARQYPVGLVAASRLGLLAAPFAGPIPNSRQEAQRVSIPRTLR
jgi:hypothetical protein